MANTFDCDEFSEFEGLSIEEEDDERDKWECAFPSSCVMPGDHMRVECHTAADAEELIRQQEAESK